LFAKASQYQQSRKGRSHPGGKRISLWIIVGSGERATHEGEKNSGGRADQSTVKIMEVSHNIDGRGPTLVMEKRLVGDDSNEGPNKKL